MTPMPTVRSLVRATVVAAVLVHANAIRAEAFETIGQLDRSEFRELSENLAAATHYKGISPAEPLGLIGFDVGIELSVTEIGDDEVFDRASDGSYPESSLLLPRLHAHKGLPFGLDIGAFVGAVPETDATVLGAELRLALLEGGVATPAVGLRASYSRVEGLDRLDLQNAGLELSVSKGVLMLTPYGGVGVVFSEATPNVDEAAGGNDLDEESFEQTKLFVGVNVNLVGLNVVVEADRTGDYDTFSAKLGLRF